ncbi:hypothetical protein CR513_37294, partial [Mucuna pruriens]
MEVNINTMVSLNDTNYHLWKEKMKDLLFMKKMHLPVLATQKPEFMFDEECDFEHQEVCDFIQHFVDDNVYNYIASETHASNLWEKIEPLYVSTYGNNKLFLLNSIVSLKFKEDTSLSDHLNEFQRILDQMLGMRIKFKDEILVLLLLNSLLESWEIFKDSVLKKEMRKKAQGSSSRSEVLVTKNGGRSQKKGREKRKSKSKSKYKNVECHYCHITGRTQKHCFLWKKENKGKKSKSKEKDHDDGDDNDDHVTPATGDDLVILQDFKLIIDSSATLHVTPRKEFFISYTSGDF